VLSRIHHVGIVVRNLEQAYGFWRDVLGLPVHTVATVSDQGVRAALLTIGESEIELLEPLAATSGIGKFLAKRGEGLHHICFATDDVAAELERARAKGIRLIDERPRPGLAGMICFLHPASTHGVLVEYAEPFADEHDAAAETGGTEGPRP
jgi:methylmalonyl-CoA/ethylmalonyl-CoA epimerase